jgi:hypothetical protein
MQTVLKLLLLVIITLLTNNNDYYIHASINHKETSHHPVVHLRRNNVQSMPKRSCSTVPVDDPIQQQQSIHHLKTFLASKAQKLTMNERSNIQQPVVQVVQVVFHMLDTIHKDFYVPTSSLETAIVQLNHAHDGSLTNSAANTGFRFIMGGINRIITDSTTVTTCQNNPMALANKYWIPGKDKLNVFVCAPSSLGFAYMPCTSSYDGTLFVHWLTFPPAEGYHPYPDFDASATLIHEAGHAFGLYHTFENDCNTPGDLVDDTPYNTVYYGDCTTLTQPRDSCPTLPGADLLNNWMQYSVDRCMTSFTAGQADRMQSETLRCMNLQNSPRLCTVLANTGTSNLHGICSSTTCKFTPTPDGSSPPLNGWCNTLDGNWGYCDVVGSGCKKNVGSGAPTSNNNLLQSMAPSMKKTIMPTFMLSPTTPKPTRRRHRYVVRKKG